MEGPDGFTAGLTTYGASPSILDRFISYKVDVVEGRFAGQTVETAVAIDELARWPMVPPHWIYLHNSVAFAATNTQPCPLSGGSAIARDRRLGQRPGPGRWVDRPRAFP